MFLAGVMFGVGITRKTPVCLRLPSLLNAGTERERWIGSGGPFFCRDNISISDINDNMSLANEITKSINHNRIHMGAINESSNQKLLTMEVTGSNTYLPCMDSGFE